MITAIIVDDDKKVRDSLKKLIVEHCPSVQVLAEAGSVDEAFSLIKKHSPQIVFLDVEMPSGTGFELLKKFTKVNFKVIFVTGHADYAIQAIKFSAVDYLLKPVDSDDLIESVSKAIREINFDHHHHYQGLLQNLIPETVQKLAVPIKDGIAFLSPEEIIRLEADGAYTQIYSIDKKNTAAKNIKEFEILLKDQSFFRSHKSHLINLLHVKLYNRVDGYFVQMSDGSTVEISRRKKDEFIELMSLR